MNRRPTIMAVTAAAAVLWLGGCTADDPPDTAQAAQCDEQRKADEAAVRTTRWDPPADVADLGGYAEIHWQARALGDPCSRVPGPTDWVYQGVVRLQPADAQRLAAAPGWEAATPEVWPGLVAFVPAGAQWRRAPDNQAGGQPGRQLYLDADHAHALFTISRS
jgi:hypothetical protein